MLKYVEVYGRHKRGVAYNHQGKRCGRPHVASWAETATVLAADLLAGSEDPRPHAAQLLGRALATLPAAARGGRIRLGARPAGPPRRRSPCACHPATSCSTRSSHAFALCSYRPDQAQAAPTSIRNPHTRGDTRPSCCPLTANQPSRSITRDGDQLNALLADSGQMRMVIRRASASRSPDR
jgi:hypothetical protein